MNSIAFGLCVLAIAQAELEEIRIASPVQGFVTEVLVRKGDKVAAGQLLLKLDDRLARIDVELAKVKVAHAEASHEVAKATLREAESRMQRLEALFKRNNAVSREEYDAGILLRDKYKAEAEVSAADVRAARLLLERQQLVLAQHETRAPAAGVVLELMRKPGEGVAEFDAVVRMLQISP